MPRQQFLTSPTLAGGVIVMKGMLRVPRSLRALRRAAGPARNLGRLIAFVGPYFQYAYTPDKAFTYTTGRLWLEN